MRSLRQVLWLSFLITLATHAQELYRTDAQNDDLSGPVKSVSSKVERSSVIWQQPGGPTLLMPIRCMECDYDRDGSRTKSGAIVDGKFFGQIIQLVRDGNGQVTEQLVVNASTGQLDRHEVMGRFGKTEETDYVDGKVQCRGTFSYDEYGNMVEGLSFDSTGKQEGRVFTKREPDRTLKERSVWGKDGQLRYQQTLDSETKVEHFTTFDQFGRVKLTWTVVDGKLASFWEEPGPPSQFGDNFTETEGKSDAAKYACHNDGRCDVSHIHYEYLDPNGPNPLSAEWRDSDGNLQFAVYYDYEIDSFRNWTYRRIWVWSPDLGKRSLYETDARVITYWQK
jgi:hypothetical protein